MPANIRDIKDRIGSVEKTKTITMAMKMVSAAKFKRNLSALDRVKGYGQAMDHVVESLGQRLYQDDALPGVIVPNDSPQVAVIVVSSDRGLCGGFNAALFKAVQGVLDNESQVDLYTVGQKAYQHYQSKNVQIADSRPCFTAQSTNAQIADYVNGHVESFLKGVYSTVLIVYNEFVSALASNQVVKQLLPVTIPNWDPGTITASDFIYEPAKETTLDRFFSLWIRHQVTLAINESLASEEGFRMVAMDSASNNAKEMIGELTLYYNRSRQAAITTELTEIVAGAASIS